MIKYHWCLAAIATSAVTARGEPLEIWISSYQDKVYYEDMVKLYRETVDEEFLANVHAYGFREMPDFALHCRFRITPTFSAKIRAGGFHEL